MLTFLSGGEKSALDKSRTSASSPSTPLSTFRSAAVLQRSHRLSTIYSSLSDSDDKTTNSSSSSDSSDSDSPPAKRPSYRSVAIAPPAKKALSSISPNSTSSIAENGTSTIGTQPILSNTTIDTSSRPFLSRPVVTDSDSDSSSSALESGSTRRVLPSPIRRRREISSSSNTASGGSVAGSDTPLGKSGSTTGRRVLSSNGKTVLKGSSKPLKMVSFAIFSCSSYV